MKRDEKLERILRSEGVDFLNTEDVLREIESQWPLPPKLEIDGVCVQPDVPNELYITDTTFRDGQQAFFMYYSPEDAKRIFELLAKLDNGSGRIIRSEFFLYTERDRGIVREILALGYKWPRVIGWGRARIEDVRLVKEFGLDEMVMLMSVSDIHIRYKFNTTRDKVVEKYLEAAEYALKYGIRLRCSFEDITRADVIGFVLPLAERLLRLSERYGVEIVLKLPDTTGVGVPYPFAKLPYSIPKLVWVFRRLLGVPSERLEFHGHGDFHMAVANAIAAWLYGASVNNGTLLGIGERAGNVPIEALVVWYARIKGSFDGMNPSVINEIAETFKAMGYNVPLYQPIVGDNAFTTGAGIHVDAQMKNPMTYLPMDPGLFGKKPKIVIGPYSGRASIRYWLKSHGYEVNEDVVEMAYRRIRALYDEGVRKTPLTDEEVRGIIEDVISSLNAHTTHA